MLYRNSLSPKVGVIFILLATTLIIFLSLKVDTLLKLDFFRKEAIAIDAQFIISKKNQNLCQENLLLGIVTNHSALSECLVGCDVCDKLPIRYLEYFAVGVVIFLHFFVFLAFVLVFAIVLLYFG